MKTNNIYFHCKSNKIDLDLVKAIKALPKGMLILPYDAEMGCMKKNGRVILYPHNLEERLATMHHKDAEKYEENHKYSEFKIKGFYYKVLKNNPFKITEDLINYKMYDEVMNDILSKERAAEYIPYRYKL